MNKPRGLFQKLKRLESIRMESIRNFPEKRNRFLFEMFAIGKTISKTDEETFGFKLYRVASSKIEAKYSKIFHFENVLILKHFFIFLFDQTV
jgi:hypothetical protein